MRMRRFLILAAALVLAGCGARNLVLRVNIFTFMDPSLRQTNFGPIPAVPGGFWSGEVALIDDQKVSLLQGLSDATNVHSVDLTFDALAIDADGAGEDTVRVYLSDAATAPRSTLPVVEIPMVLSPGLTDTVHVDLAGDPRVVGLFQAKSMRMSVTTSLRGPSSGNALSGTFRVTGLEAVVIAGWKGF